MEGLLKQQTSMHSGKQQFHTAETVVTQSKSSISMMGTVSAIDESKSILTVSDIDGVEHKVHISEFTRACTLDAATRTTARNPKADIKDFKKGDEKGGEK